jgi:hypothetical protein
MTDDIPGDYRDEYGYDLYKDAIERGTASADLTFIVRQNERLAEKLCRELSWIHRAINGGVFVLLVFVLMYGYHHGFFRIAPT